MRVLVTGATGTLGRQLLTRLVERNDVDQVIGISRDELKQSEIARHPKLKLALCDVRDAMRLERVSRGVDLIFHTAALKQVPTLEANPDEAISTNVTGTQNVLAAQAANSIRRVILSSTDKACYPVNIYGVTKAAAEKLVLAHKGNVVVRYGNVIGSRGSVVQMFADSLRETQTVNITDPMCTRFWLTQDQAAQFTIEQALYGPEGLCIPTGVQASPVTWLAQAVAEAVGVANFKQNVVGLRPGEKLHETMRTEHEGDVLFSGDPSCWCPKGFLLSAVIALLGEAA